MTNAYIVYVKRPDVPYVIWKRLGDGPSPRFVNVYKDGTWTGHASKLIAAPAIAQGTDQDNPVIAGAK